MHEPRPKKPTTAGGFFIAALTLGGAVAGGVMCQPSIGLLAGFGLGVAIALSLWWKDRER